MSATSFRCRHRNALPPGTAVRSTGTPHLVEIAQPPELLGIAERAIGDEIGAVAVAAAAVKGRGGETTRDEAHALVADRPAVRGR